MIAVLSFLVVAYLFAAMVALMALSAHDPAWQAQLWVRSLDFKAEVPRRARVYGVLTLALFVAIWPGMLVRWPQLAD